MKLVYIVTWQHLSVIEGVVENEEEAKKLIQTITGREPVFVDDPLIRGKIATVTWPDGEKRSFNLYQRMYYEALCASDEECITDTACTSDQATCPECGDPTDYSCHYCGEVCCPACPCPCLSHDERGSESQN